jgi:hypothetical protein
VNVLLHPLNSEQSYRRWTRLAGPDVAVEVEQRRLWDGGPSRWVWVYLRARGNAHGIPIDAHQTTRWLGEDWDEALTWGRWLVDHIDTQAASEAALRAQLSYRPVPVWWALGRYVEAPQECECQSVACCDADDCRCGPCPACGGKGMTDGAE